MKCEYTIFIEEKLSEEKLKNIELEKELQIYADGYAALLCKLYMKKHFNDIKVRDIEECISKIRGLEEENVVLKAEKVYYEEKYNTLRFMLNVNYGKFDVKGGGNK